MTDWISNTINALQVQTRQRTQDAAMHHTMATETCRQGPLTGSSDDQAQRTTRGGGGGRGQRRSSGIGPLVSCRVLVWAGGGEAQVGDGAVFDGQDLQLPAVDPNGLALFW
jgi:hypothetical protein